MEKVWIIVKYGELEERWPKGYKFNLGNSCVDSYSAETCGIRHYYTDYEKALEDFKRIKDLNPSGYYSLEYVPLVRKRKAKNSAIQRKNAATEMCHSATARTSTLSLNLKTDSGYSCKEEHRISVDQWERICKILAEEPLKER